MVDYRELDPKHLVRDSYDRISHAYRGDTLPRDRGYFRWLDVLMPYLRQWLEETGFEVLWQEFLPEGKGGHRIVLARRSSSAGRKA